MPVLASLSRWNAMGHADRRGNGGPSAPAVQHKAPPTHRSARPLAKIPSVASTRAAASARSTRLPVLVRSGYDFAVAAWRDAGTRSAARRWLLLVRRGDAIGATRPLPRGGAPADQRAPDRRSPIGAGVDAEAGVAVSLLGSCEYAAERPSAPALVGERASRTRRRTSCWGERVAGRRSLSVRSSAIDYPLQLLVEREE